MIEQAILDKAQAIVQATPRKYVRLSDVLAVVERESGGVPIFTGKEPLYHDNLKTASRITGLSADAVKQVCTIRQGAYKGQVSKFRCEPSIWIWSRALSNRDWTIEERLLLSCSFGLGQKLARYLVTGIAPGDWISLIQQFMGSLSLQLTYCAGDLDRLLAASGGDRSLAFTRYNAGPNASMKSPAYKAYGLPVAHRADEFQKQLGQEITQ